MDGYAGEFVAREPHPQLRHLVRGYVGYTQRDLTLPVHRGLPTSSLPLAISLADPLHILQGPGIAAGGQAAQAVAAGLHLGPTLLAQPRFQCGLQLELHPPGAEALLGVPARELASATVDIADLPVGWNHRLVDRLAAAPDWPGRFDVLDRELLHAMRPVRLVAEIQWAWRRLLADSGSAHAGSRAGRAPVETLAADVGWSRRHFTGRFTQQVGVTPKQAARLARFERSRDALRSGWPDTLADLAARCGYYDQAHMANEWRALAGCSPSTWIREELPFLQVVVGTGQEAWEA